MEKPNEINHKHIYFAAGIVAIAILALAGSVGYSAYSNSHSKPLALESYQVNSNIASPTPVTIVQQAPSSKPANTAPSPVPTPKTDYSFQISKIKTALNLANGYDAQKQLDQAQKDYESCLSMWSNLPDNNSYCLTSKQKIELTINNAKADLELRKINLNHLLQIFENGNPTQADFDLYSKTITF